MALVIVFKAFHFKETNKTVLTLIKNPNPFLKQKYILLGKTTLYIQFTAKLNF